MIGTKIVFSHEQVAQGFPPGLTLTKKEQEAMRLYHLGGIEAWRTETAKVACRTVDSLCKKGLFDRGSITELGKVVAKICGQNDEVE